jgi:spore maturation protein CgeB
MSGSLRIVILGLSITSSWGNGHATTYRALVRELERRGHDLLFLERDQPWYAQNRDLPRPPYGRTVLYGSLDELRDSFASAVREADLVVVGSFVPDGVAVGDWVQREAGGIKAFYDIDTPVTLARLARGEHDYLKPSQIAGYDLYLSFTGGPTLARLEREYGSPRARVLYCSVDPQLYYPKPQPLAWHLQPRSAAQRRGVAAATGGPVPRRALHRRRAAISGGHRLAVERRIPAAPATREAPRFL